MTETPKEKLIDLAEDFDNAMLVSQAKNGDLRSRPMSLAKIEDDGTFYFATAKESDKIDEVRADGEVNLSFQGGSKFLSVSGRAQVLHDRALIEELWSPEWKVWFPEGKDDPSLCILKVNGRRGEYWDMSGTSGLSYLWEAGKALVRGESLSTNDRDINATAELR